jgi:hypothetical protein
VGVTVIADFPDLAACADTGATYPIDAAGPGLGAP